MRCSQCGSLEYQIKNGNVCCLFCGKTASLGVGIAQIVVVNGKPVAELTEADITFTTIIEKATD
jgi:hypothetical protein